MKIWPSTQIALSKKASYIYKLNSIAKWAVSEAKVGEIRRAFVFTDHEF
jgi:hypothetical protein